MRPTLATTALMFCMSLALVGTAGATVLTNERSAEHSVYNGIEGSAKEPAFVVLPVSSQLAIKQALRSVW